MAKRKKSQIKGIAEERLKPSTLVAGSLSTVLASMVLYNLFLGQHGPVQVPDGARTKVSVEAPGKASRTVTLRYDELVEDVQRELLALGHFQGMVDGVNGPMTREAVLRYQKSQQLEETGEVSPQLLEHIHFTRKLAQASEFTGSVKPAQDSATQDPAVADLVVEDLADMTSKKRKAAGTEKLVQPEPDKLVLGVQKRLARLGFDPHSRSGLLDDATKSAILTFEMEHGMAMQGRISKPFLAALRNAEMRAGLGD